VAAGTLAAAAVAADVSAAGAAGAASVAVDSVLAASRAAATAATAATTVRQTFVTATSSAVVPRCCSALSRHTHTRTGINMLPTSIGRGITK